MYFEGFNGASDGVDIDIYLPRRGYTVSANVTADTGRYTGISLGMNGTQSCRIPVTANASYTICFAFKTAYWLHYATADFLEIWYGAPTGIHIDLQLMGNGEIAVVTAADTRVTSGLRGKDGIWTFVEFKFTIDDATGSYILKVNGKEYLNRTGIDTQNGGTPEITSFRFNWFGDVSYYMYIDDIYIGTDFLDDYRIDRIDPDGDGAVTDWTPLAGDNYAAVDDGNSVDDDATYVQTNTTTHQDLYTYSDLSALGTVHAVQMNVVCRETDANNFYIEQLVRISTTVYDETPIAIAGQTYEIIARVMDEDPATSSAWTLTAINAAQFGFEATT